jgi:hypothetical protein
MDRASPAGGPATAQPRGAAAEPKGKKMIRNLKALGLALVAVLALSAMSASAASAQNGLITASSSFFLHGEDEPKPIEGPPINALTAFGEPTVCKEATYTGGKVNSTTKTGHHVAQPSGQSDITVSPDYKNCTSGGGLPETITMNGCDYVLHIGKTTGIDKYEVSADLVCPKGAEVTIDIYLSALDHANHPLVPDCVIHIPPTKPGIPGGTLTDETNGHLTLGGKFTPFTVTLTGPSPCTPVTVTDHNAILDIAVTLTGRSEATGGKVIPLKLSHL